jgi:glutamate/aspartate transport system substrate-binding protein
MFRKNDADFAIVANRALANLMRSGEINKIYDKWFVAKLPDGSQIGMPMSPLLKVAFQLQAFPE